MRHPNDLPSRMSLRSKLERTRSAHRLAIDTLGGSAPPTDLVRGALDALASNSESTALVFFGDAREIAPLIEGTPHDAVHAPRCIEVDDPLRAVLRNDIGSSMSSAVAAVAEGRADAVVSAGSTGALVALSRHLIGNLPHLRRPAIQKTLGGEDGHSFAMLDLGANIGVDAEQLRQFALMGAAAARAAGVDDPAVALLNIGAEVRKGPPTVQAAARLLLVDERLRYVGFLEPDRMFAGGADVIVADGFAGNIALKAAEGATRLARHVVEGKFGELAQSAPSTPRWVQALHAVRDACDPQRYNGATLLGLAKVVVKSHGSADRQGFASAVRHAREALAADLVTKVAACL